MGLDYAYDCDICDISIDNGNNIYCEDCIQKLRNENDLAGVEVEELEDENITLKQQNDELQEEIDKLEDKIGELEDKLATKE